MDGRLTDKSQKDREHGTLVEHDVVLCVEWLAVLLVDR